MNVRPLSPASRRTLPACPALALRRTFAVLALPGCALALAPGSIAADTLLASGPDPLSGGGNIGAWPPGGFEGGAYSGALEGVALPLHPDWEVILAGGRGEEAESTLSHRVTSRYRLNESLTLRASWQGDLLASGRSAPHALGAIGDLGPCDSRPPAGDPKRCEGFRPGTCGRRRFDAPSPRRRDLPRRRGHARGSPLRESRLVPGRSPRITGESDRTLRARRRGVGNAVARCRGAAREGHRHPDGGSRRARRRVRACGYRRSRPAPDGDRHGADFALDTRWLHLTGREDRMAGDSQRGDFPRNHVQASLRADRSGLSTRWRVRTVSGFWNNLRNTRYAAWIRHDITFRKRDAFGLRGVDLVGGVLNLRNRGSSIDSTAPGATGATDRLNPALGRTLFLSARLSLDS